MSALDETWGYATADMYTNRWALIEPNLEDSAFVLVDWGSDAGWFSLAVAKAFPRSTVVAVEAGIMSDGEGLRMHRDKMASYGVTNNIIVDSIFGPATFEALQDAPADYQLVLSVFHHMGDGFGQYLDTAAQWDEAFRALISAANVTFFEVPSGTGPEETPHRIETWFAGRDVETTVRAALAEADIEVAVEMLGETVHGSKGPRQLIKISHTVPFPAADSGQIASAIEAAAGDAAIRPKQKARLVAGRVLRSLGLRKQDIVSENE